jgi:hypothetical protein
VEFGFKYRLKLADSPDIRPFLFEATQGSGEDRDGFDTVDEKLQIHSEASEVELVPDKGQNINVSEHYKSNDTPSDVEVAEIAEEPQTPINIAQQILEERIQDHLQDKLLYCPGSGADARDLSIDGIAVDLTSFREQDECIDAAQTSCTLTGKVTIFQRFNNIHSSSLQSTQAGLATLRAGMNEENIFVSEGDVFNEVEFLGGIIGISRQGSSGEGRDISLNNNGAGVSAVILSSAQSFIDTHAGKLSTTGQGIIGVFAMALLALVVARRKARNKSRAIGINEIALDGLQSYGSEDDSWAEDGFPADNTRHNEYSGEEITPPSVEVYLKKKKNIFGFVKKQDKDHVSVAGI